MYAVTVIKSIVHSRLLEVFHWPRWVQFSCAVPSHNDMHFHCWQQGKATPSHTAVVLPGTRASHSQPITVSILSAIVRRQRESFVSKSLSTFSSQNFCSFYLNLCGLVSSFTPVFLFLLSDISFILLFSDRFQPYWSCINLLLILNRTFSAVCSFTATISRSFSNLNQVLLESKQNHKKV